MLGQADALFGYAFGITWIQRAKRKRCAGVWSCGLHRLVLYIMPAVGRRAPVRRLPTSRPPHGVRSSAVRRALFCPWQATAPSGFASRWFGLDMTIWQNVQTKNLPFRPVSLDGKVWHGFGRIMGVHVTPPRKR